MTEITPATVPVTATAPSDALGRISGRAVDSLTALFGESSTAATFSSAQPVGDHVVITASAWERAGGFGFGGGDGVDGKGQAGGGGGAGGGGAAVSRPVAVIRVGADGITVKPVIDITKLAVTVLLSAFGVWKVLRR